jgi:GNAT superfamily N-acetyltransferase
MLQAHDRGGRAGRAGRGANPAPHKLSLVEGDVAFVLRIACGEDDTVVLPLDLRSTVTTADRAFIVEMARHACVIEDWPLPEPDSEDVESLLPRSTDVAIIAADPDTRTDVGAVWTFDHDPPLVVHGNGNAVPEVAIAVMPTRRNRGIGAALLDALIDECSGMHAALALNVHRRNPAQRLYRRKGFRVAGQGRGDLGVAMVADL